jgi:hypothetical protein
MKLPNTRRTLIIGLSAILGLVLVGGLLGLGQRDVDWQPTFTEEKKTPYAASLLRERVGDLFPDQEILTARSPVFEHLAFLAPRGGGYLFVNDDIPLDADSRTALLDFVAAGNHVLMATASFDEELLAYLGVEVSYQNLQDSLAYRLYGPGWEAHSYRLPPKVGGAYFSDWDARYAEARGRYGERSTSILQVYEGEGSLILCATPLLFSNYYLLQPETSEYLAGILSLLPTGAGPLYWDEYYKKENLARARRRDRGDNDSPGLLAYFMQQPALRWGLLLGLVSLLLYALFEAKRRQRVIPVMNPLPNTTLDFTRTVGRLYFQRADHHNLGRKRIKVLLEHIRAHYFLRTDARDEEFVRTLAGKSGLPEADIRLLCRQIDRFEQQTEVSENQLIELNQAIEAFYQRAAR